jgi:hypothetical protein
VAYREFAGEGYGFRVAAHLVRALQAEWSFLARAFAFPAPPGVPPLAIDNDAALGSGP